MTSPVFVFYLTCLCFGKSAQTTAVKFSSSVHPQTGFVSVKTGDKLTLPCSYEGDFTARLYWYKQTLGQKPGLISGYYTLDENGTFYGEFKDNPRFTLDTEKGTYHLTITDLQISDSATYSCIGGHAYMTEILESIIVSVKSSGLSVQTLVHQSESESVQPGDSVTLNCTVQTGTCDGEHSVYWFKNSEESQPGLIYTHGGRNDQCERKADTQTHTCVYNLHMQNLNLSHAGTYYCAVASCGHILFGDGTKLDFPYEMDSLVLVYCLSAGLMFTTILVILLAFLVYRMYRRNSLQSPESEARVSASSSSNAEGHREADNLHYAALSVHLPNRSRRQRNNTKDESVYSSVKQ